MATIFEQIIQALGLEPTQDNQPVQADSPLDISAPDVQYRDYTPTQRATEVGTGMLDVLGQGTRGATRGLLELPSDIYAVGKAGSQCLGLPFTGKDPSLDQTGFLDLRRS